MAFNTYARLWIVNRTRSFRLNPQVQSSHMARSTPLARLYDLDKAFAVQLDRLLHDERYISQLMALQEDGLIQVVDYLNEVRLSPAK